MGKKKILFTKVKACYIFHVLPSHAHNLMQHYSDNSILGYIRRQLGLNIQ